MPSGKMYDEDGNWIRRMKLVVESVGHEDISEIHLNGLFTLSNYWGESPDDVEEKLPAGVLDPKREELCAFMSKYKYLIIIDGQVSTW